MYYLNYFCNEDKIKRESETNIGDNYEAMGTDLRNTPLNYFFNTLFSPIKNIISW